MSPRVAAVAVSATHSFSKPLADEIRLVAGFGVEGDAHLGATVKHRSRVRANPMQPNLRQVHLVHAELFDELKERGFEVGPGQLGENITTRGVGLLDLPRGARLHIGASAVLEVTGLRNPCHQIDDFRLGLLKAVVGRDAAGRLVRKTGVMSIVVAGGVVRPGDAIVTEWPAGEALPLEVV